MWPLGFQLLIPAVGVIMPSLVCRWAVQWGGGGVGHQPHAGPHAGPDRHVSRHPQGASLSGTSHDGENRGVMRDGREEKIFSSVIASLQRYPTWSHFNSQANFVFNFEFLTFF